MTAKSSTLRAAAVGLHIHAGSLHPDRNHGLLKSFRAQDGVELVAYCEGAPPLPDAVAEIRQFDPAARVYADVDSLLAHEDFDMAVVMLPPSEAIGAATRLAQAGKHLFIEKQAARTAAELAPLRAAAAATGIVVQVGYPWPCHPVPQAIRRLLDAGALGRLLDIEARLVTTQVGPGLRDPQHWMYRRETEGGGILHMESGHWLTLFRFFSRSEVTAVMALCQRLSDHIQEGLEDVATVALSFANGVHACLHMGYLLPGVGPRNDTGFALRGTLGTVAWPDTGQATFTLSSAAPGWQAAPVQDFHLTLAERPVYAGQWGHEFVRAFIAAVRAGGGPVPVSLDDAWRVLQIVDACYESSRTGRRVDLPTAL